jgi:hypothetical protein
MTQTIPQFKNEPIVVLLLGFVTCGLYLIYWNIKAAEVINAAAEKEIQELRGELIGLYLLHQFSHIFLVNLLYLLNSRSIN